MPEINEHDDGGSRFLLERDQTCPALHHPMLVQPFLSSIQSNGELSVIEVDGVISHAVRKRPATGDYRIQSLYGGVESPDEPTTEERNLVDTVLKGVPHDLLYARVDLVDGPDGHPLLMELELIEPYLYPEQGPDLGIHLAEALSSRL